MSALSAAKAVLEADATLLTTATGGIWDFDETKQLGLSRTLTGDAFDSNEVIKPCILMKQRSQTPNFALADDADQYVAVNEMIECWFYEDSGYSNIETMRDRVYVLLHSIQLTGTFQVFWAGSFRPGIRDTDLDANVSRSDFQVFGRKSA